MDSSADSSIGSRIFEPFRCLGLVSNHVPLQLRYSEVRKETYIVTCVGRSVQQYNFSHLGIDSVSDLHDGDISLIAVDGQRIYTVVDNKIHALRRGRYVEQTYTADSHAIECLLPFGDNLVAINRNNSLITFDVTSSEVVGSFSFGPSMSNVDTDELEPSTFTCCAVMHPATYINKVLLGSREGTLRLFNVRRLNIVHTLVSVRMKAAVSCIEQAPALDVAAVGSARGDVVLVNLRSDSLLFRFDAAALGGVTSLAFVRPASEADADSDSYRLVAGSGSGALAVWSLAKRRLAAHIRDAHRSAVGGLRALPNASGFVSSGVDNALRVWIFDTDGDEPRLLRERDGHPEPPAALAFAADERVENGGSGFSLLADTTPACSDCVITCASDGTLRRLGIAHESANRSFGRASVRKAAKRARQAGVDTATKVSGRGSARSLPPIVAFALSAARRSDWDALVALHAGSNVASTWNLSRCSQGVHLLVPARFRQSAPARPVRATCCDMTACGNFALIGYSSGHVDRFNMQSGLHRGAYAYQAEKDADGVADEAALRGVCVDALNQYVLAVTDAHVTAFAFRTRRPLYRVRVVSLKNGAAGETLVTVGCTRLHREAALLAIGVDERCVLFDCESRVAARSFATAGRSRVTAATVSHDARWCVVAAADGGLRVWHVPSAQLIDAFRFHVASPCVALAFSPGAEYLATAHADELGVFLWSNRAVFHHVDTTPLPITDNDSPTPTVQLHRVAAAPHPSESRAALLEDAGEFVDARKLVTLSLLPESRWRCLLNLDAIRARNKPREPVRILKAAPFYLDEVRANAQALDAASSDRQQTTKLVKLDSTANSELARMLSPPKLGEESMQLDDEQPSSKDQINSEFLLAEMKRWHAVKIDYEVRSLAPDAGGSLSLLLAFLESLTHALRSLEDFELASSYTALFLKLHAETLIRHPADFAKPLELLADAQNAGWARVEQLLSLNSSVVNYLQHTVLE